MSLRAKAPPGARTVVANAGAKTQICFGTGPLAELFRTFKENAFPCESYMSQMDCESDGQCYFHLSSCKSHASLVEQALLNSGVSQNSLLSEAR